MADPSGNSPSKYHHLFSRKPSHAGNIEVISSISSIWEDDHIEKLEKNQWKCLWCNVKCQGINTTKALDHIIRTKFMHIKICRASIDKYYLSIYKDLKKIKSSKKGLLNDYSQKWYLLYHTYRIINQKLLSQIFIITTGVCTHHISMQHLIHHHLAQAVAHHLKAIKLILKKVQYFSWYTITHRKW